MYYKVTNSMTQDIVDVIKKIHYIQYQEKHKILKNFGNLLLTSKNIKGG